MASTIDNIFFEKSLECELSQEDSKFKSKEWIWMVDSNNGNYQSGQLIFDCSSFATASKYCYWADAYFLIPIVLSTECPDNNVATGMDSTKYIHALKSGY